ncbi:MAG: hypothetical protein Q3966_06415 [Neisseria sp.]|nr:hypothetical protein [Neisseria sp.]
MMTFWQNHNGEILLVLQLLGYGAGIALFFLAMIAAAVKYTTAYLGYLRFDRLAPEEFLADEKLVKLHQDMEADGFALRQAVRGVSHNPKLEVQTMLYRSSRHPGLIASANRARSGDMGEVLYFVDLFQEYADGDTLTVNNMPYAAIPFIPQLAVYSVPSARTVAELCRLHQAIRRKTKLSSPVVPPEDEDYADILLPWLGRQREYLTRLGWVQAGAGIDGRYYYTFKGAILLAWRTFPFLRGLYVRRRSRLAYAAADGG